MRGRDNCERASAGQPTQRRARCKRTLINWLATVLRHPHRRPPPPPPPPSQPLPLPLPAGRTAGRLVPNWPPLGAAILARSGGPLQLAGQMEAHLGCAIDFPAPALNSREREVMWKLTSQPPVCGSLPSATRPGHGGGGGGVGMPNETFRREDAQIRRAHYATGPLASSHFGPDLSELSAESRPPLPPLVWRDDEESRNELRLAVIVWRPAKTAGQSGRAGVPSWACRPSSGAKCAP